MDITECYQLLEIEPTDSLPDMKQAYRDIVFVWHPDRMTSNTRVQKKAESKLKRINVAYEKLQSYLAPENSKLTKISIYPQQVILDFGERYTFAVIGLDQNGHEVELENVTWEVSGGGTIYAEGSFFADYKSGKFNVTATSKGISNTAAIVIRESVTAIEALEQNKKISTTPAYKYSEPEKKISRQPELKIEVNVDFPWKRLIVWGLLVLCYLMDNSLSLNFLQKVDNLLLLMWIVGQIKPSSVLTFGFPNNGYSVTQLYLCLPMLFIMLTDNRHTVWNNLGWYFCMLWLFGMIDPKMTFNFGMETRWAITGLYIFIGLLMGAIWGGVQGISLAFSG